MLDAGYENDLNFHTIVNAVVLSFFKEALQHFFLYIFSLDIPDMGKFHLKT
ncbi:MAG: hypothetical protein K0S04_1128 [Herbinix sp.]|jgi:hypothetical protein|nr:hypothetical protein [Herbinix sp.]